MMEKEVPLKGSLKHYSLPQIITSLNKKRETGILTVIRDHAKKNIYFSNGDIIFASSNKTGDRLGDMLLKAGNLTADQYDRSAKIFEQTGKRKGIILLELGYLNHKDLFQALKNQIREIILSLFEWEDGTFRFEETIPSAEAIALRVPIPVKDIIKWGRERIEDTTTKADPAIIRKINKLYGNISRLSYYDILEVQINASVSDIKKAYLQMAKCYHPDRYHSLSDNTLKKKLTALFDFLNKAYNMLSNEASRTKYDKSLLRIQKKILGSGMTGLEVQFKQGIVEFKKGNFWNAADYFRELTRLKPEKATYWSHLSLALSKISGRTKEAEEAMLKAIKLESHNANYYVHLGIVYLNAGLRQRAIRQFETALIWDPTNKRASAELKKLTDNKEKTSKAKNQGSKFLSSFSSKLLKKI